MIREIEKLNLTKRQYKLLGNLLASISVIVFLAIFYISEFSVGLSVVFILVGFEFLIFGCIFNIIANKLRKTDEENILKYHRATKKNKRITLGIIFVMFIMLIILGVTYYFVSREANITQEVINVTESETEQQTEQMQYVFITENGERYHFKDDCSKGEYFQISIEEAIEKGLTPCKRCVE